ncbi:MAG TPA: UDP-N-acetylglucosamine--N-acetylmuramyl-(pentapeptide) pyrophosphoryl-undecaprenol N-acetylglucosamine transferase [Tepidisphaeraceae bacterium]|nr:UDP-N-acetylglucosamine--N-acetylmuramyl-(pentapeptide) pyrophosphoryl-undecaprenol N-acetylglucosamine transferase [Tepidisphaeraceae bacterium]
MNDSPTILLAGGGTGGHLYPGISVALALKEVWPEVRPLFLCTTREIDRIILEPTGFEFIPQPIVPPVRSISGLLRFWRSWRETKDLVRQLLRKNRPVAALGLGGYAAGVAIKYAAHKGIPTAILNPDVIPGKANKYLAKYVQALCCQYEQSRRHLSADHQPKIRITGCPVRPDILTLPNRAEASARLGIDPRLLTLTITGASQGAQTVNDAILALADQINLQGWQILHLAGRDHAAAVTTTYRQRALQARVIDFTPAMADVWSVTDLAICRSGASTCAELTVCGIPSILMPYPYHKDMHQRANAKTLADAGAALLLDDEKDAAKNAAKLRPLLEPLLRDASKRSAMATAAKNLAKPDAAAQVAAVLRQLAESWR